MSLFTEIITAALTTLIVALPTIWYQNRKLNAEAEAKAEELRQQRTGRELARCDEQIENLMHRVAELENAHRNDLAELTENQITIAELNTRLVTLSGRINELERENRRLSDMIATWKNAQQPPRPAGRATPGP